MKGNDEERKKKKVKQERKCNDGFCSVIETMKVQNLQTCKMLGNDVENCDKCK